MADLGAETERIVRFGLVGFGATFTYILATMASAALLQLSPVSASIVGQCTSMGVSYVGHQYYSFKVVSDHRTYLWRFIFVAVAAFSANYAITRACTEVLGLSRLTAIVAVSIAMPIANYLANRFWVFLPGMK